LSSSSQATHVSPFYTFPFSHSWGVATEFPIAILENTRIYYYFLVSAKPPSSNTVCSLSEKEFFLGVVSFLRHSSPSQTHAHHSLVATEARHMGGMHCLEVHAIMYEWHNKAAE
jgi:hypothetical protein